MPSKARKCEQSDNTYLEQRVTNEEIAGALKFLRKFSLILTKDVEHTPVHNDLTLQSQSNISFEQM